MTLREKFYNSKISTNKFRNEESKICVEIAEEFAIGFANWLQVDITIDLIEKLTTKELLEIYKKTL